MTPRTLVTKTIFQSMLRNDAALVNHEVSEAVLTTYVLPPIIKDCKIPKLHVKNGTLSPQVQFINCDIEELILENVTGEELIFSGGKYLTIKIKTDHVVTHNDFKNIKFEGINPSLELEISDLKCEALVITKCLLKNLTFEDCEAVKITLRQVDIIDNFIWDNLHVSDSLTLATISISDGRLKNPEVKKLNLMACIIKKELVLDSGLCNYFGISGSSDLNKIEFYNISLGDFIMFLGAVKELIFDPLELKTLTIFHEGGGILRIDKFHLNATFANVHPMDITIRNLQSREFTITNFRNAKTFRFLDSEILHTLNLDYCNLKPTLIQSLK
jgi:hypothetical protein